MSRSDWVQAIVRSSRAHEGQALLEYAIVLGLVALLTLGVLQAMGTNVSGTVGGVSQQMTKVLNS